MSSEKKKKQPVHDEIWSMYMVTATTALHQFEQAIQQKAEFLLIALVLVFVPEIAQPVSLKLASKNPK